MRDYIRTFFTFRHLSTKHLLVKSTFFSLFSAGVTSLTVFLFTGKLSYTLGTLIVDLLVRFFMYFTFEKNWELIHQKVS